MPVKAPVLVLEVKQFRTSDYSTGFVIMPLINQMTTVGYCRVSAPMSLKRERTIPATFKSKYQLETNTDTRFEAWAQGT